MSLLSPEPGLLLDSWVTQALSFFTFSQFEWTYLRVVSVPPHVSECAHLAGPQHCRCVDLFVLCGDERKRQVYVFQGT